MSLGVTLVCVAQVWRDLSLVWDSSGTVGASRVIDAIMVAPIMPIQRIIEYTVLMLLTISGGFELRVIN
ncbi:Uncharacterised protein [Mycobacteroides abscessus subsp. massiliense]|nr:Uncharacterised protein [Mycobacteroides abscessus subsp. massiliense]